MPDPTFTAPPVAPQPTDSKSVFNTRAFSFFGWFSGFTTELAEAISWIGGKATDASNSAAASALSAAGALTSETNASAVVLSAANYRGPWASLSGALASGSVWHAGQYWVLQSALANVASVTPGTNLAVWAPLVAGAAPSVLITANTTAVPGVRYLFDAPNVTLTLPAVLAKGDYFGFADLVGNKTCAINFNGHKFRGRAAGVVVFDVPFTGGSATYENATEGLV